MGYCATKSACAKLYVKMDHVYFTYIHLCMRLFSSFFKRYFMIDQQIAWHFVQYSEYLSMQLK